MRTILMTLLCLLMMSVSISAQDSLVLGTMDSPLARLGQEILQEAYQRIGIQVETTVLPAERALHTANSGEVDGEVLRIKGIQESYPNLRMVPVSVLTMEGVVFTKNVTFEVMGWESLKPYRIGILRGSKFAEQGTRGMTVGAVNTYRQVLLKLDAGRDDVAVMARTNGLIEIGKLNMKDIRVLEPPLITVELYHYVHKKHEYLLPKITQVLQDMVEEGRIQEIKEQFIAKASSQ